jgi:hypothetical protein
MANKKTTTKVNNEKTEPKQELTEVLSLLQTMREENAKALKALEDENNKLKTEIEQMKKEQTEEALEGENNTVETSSTNAIEVANDRTDRLLETLVNRKMDREVTIVHNAEMFGGMSTYIKLSTMTIDFRKMGEQRVLSWQQFEELCNRYRKFIDRGLIKVTPEYRYLCDTYQIGCYDVDGKKTLTSDILNKLPDMTNEQLETCYNDLYDTDKNILLNYWLGQCYARPENRDKRFYNRYKIELLNRLSNSSVFDNILADMNFEEARR